MQGQTNEEKSNLMIRTRQIAYEKSRVGFLHVLQKGNIIENPTEDSVKGPIRLRLAKDSEEEEEVKEESTKSKS